MEFSQSITEYDIVGIGVSTLDLLTIVEEFSFEDSVQKAVDAKFQGGGPVATALAAASQLGANVAMIDSIGDDFIGQSILQEFKKYGVVTNNIQITSDTTSSIASVWVYNRDGKRAIAYSPGNSPELTEHDIPLEVIKKTQIIHTTWKTFSMLSQNLSLSKRLGSQNFF